MLTILKRFERITVTFLLALLMLAVLSATVELAVILGEQAWKPPRFLLDLNELLEFFGFFLMVVIGIELLETIKAYLDTEVLHVEVVFLAAMVAMARKVIILDYKELDPDVMFGISAVLLALCVGYYLLKKSAAYGPRQSAPGRNMAEEQPGENKT